MTLEQVKRKFTDCGGAERMVEMILETPNDWPLRLDFPDAGNAFADP